MPIVIMYSIQVQLTTKTTHDIQNTQLYLKYGTDKLIENWIMYNRV